MLTIPLSVYKAAYHRNLEPFLSLLELHNLQYETAQTYGEPGYPDPENLIIFTDWHDVPQSFYDLLGDLGHFLEWPDEWYITDEGKAYRTVPDSYHWQPSVLFIGCEVYTPDTPLEEIVEAFKSTDYAQIHEAIPSTLLPGPDDLLALGYKKYQSGLQTGLHIGMNDNPAKIAKEALSQGYESIVFTITETSQFYTTWEAYVC